MSDESYSLRELRGTISRIDSLTQQLLRMQNQQASQIAQLSSQVMDVGQSAMGMMFWGNQMSRALEMGHPLGVAMPLMGALTLGISRGLTAANMTQALGKRIREGHIAGDREGMARIAMEHSIKLMVGFIIGF